MPRPSSLNPDNILRFLQVTSGAASANEIAAALHLGKALRKPLFRMLASLKKRGAIVEVPGGRYLPAGRKDRGEAGGKAEQSMAQGRAGFANQSGTEHGSTGNVP
jgi:hypothetical protein